MDCFASLAMTVEITASAARVPSAAEPLDNIRERNMAGTSACSRTDVSALQRRCIDDGGVGLDASADG